MNESIHLQLTRQLTRLALKRCCVLTDQLRQVGSEAEQLVYRPMSDESAADILILGKEHYSEQNRVFPIQSRRELSKILTLEAENTEGVMLFSIGDYIDGKRNVLCWTIKPQVLADKGLKPLFIVPESALLLRREDEQLLAVERAGRSFWYVRYQGKYLSAEKKGLISSADMFLASAGLSAQVERVELDDSAYLQRLAEAVLPVLLKNLSGFNARMRSLDSVDWLQHVKFSGTAAAALLVGYFSLTSVYLNMRLDSAREAQVEVGGKTKEVFQIKEELSRIEQKNLSFDKVMSQPNASNVVWRLISPLMKKGVNVSQLSLLPSGLFILRAEADKATDVLEFIKRDPQVVEPQFRGQTAVVKDKERFEVAFKIRQGQ